MRLDHVSDEDAVKVFFLYNVGYRAQISRRRRCIKVQLKYLHFFV